ncbi:MAG: CoA transferase [Chloroflexi bacterium]|nr:CoA transferase [Chloroflexota bacterium]
MRLPLAGFRVLDLTVYQHGPYASTILANLGADVIKVEEVQSGDPGRYAWYSRETGLSSFFEAHNHGKRSIALNLKHPRGREVFLRLAKSAMCCCTTSASPRWSGWGSTTARSQR